VLLLKQFIQEGSLRLQSRSAAPLVPWLELNASVPQWKAAWHLLGAERRPHLYHALASYVSAKRSLCRPRFLCLWPLPGAGQGERRSYRRAAFRDPTPLWIIL